MFWQEEDLIKYLQEELKSKDKELFIVVSQKVEKERSWCLDDDSASQANMFNSVSSLDDTTDQCNKAFNAPGLKYIDQELSSMESSLEGTLSLKDESMMDTKAKLSWLKVDIVILRVQITQKCL